MTKVIQPNIGTYEEFISDASYILHCWIRNKSIKLNGTKLFQQKPSLHQTNTVKVWFQLIHEKLLHYGLPYTSRGLFIPTWLQDTSELQAKHLYKKYQPFPKAVTSIKCKICHSIGFHFHHFF